MTNATDGCYGKTPRRDSSVQATIIHSKTPMTSYVQYQWHLYSSNTIKSTSAFQLIHSEAALCDSSIEIATRVHDFIWIFSSEIPSGITTN